jgi:SAM-dependent methyltransferase
VADDLDRRELRLSFDQNAEAYDRSRPVLPDAVFDDLLELADLAAGASVLEIGCGSGQATVPLARRGLRVTALELGAQLAALARSRLADYPSVTVITSSFEDWQHDSGLFDAVVAVNSLHWIDPDVRFTKPARVLKPGGAMAVMGYRWAESPGPFLEAVQDDSRAVGYPGDPPPPAALIDAWHFPPEATRLFWETAARRYEFSQSLTPEAYLANLASQSTTHQLGPEIVEQFLDRVRHRLLCMDVREVTRDIVGLLTVGRTRS